MSLEQILNENHHLDIPDWVLDTEVARFVKSLESKPGFDPATVFDPKKHLKYTSSGKKYNFEDLGIKKTHVEPINDIAAVEPFQLFTQEAIDMMAWEVFSDKELLRRHGRTVTPANSKKASPLDFQVSGFIESTRFTKSVWQSKELQNIFNEVVGDDVILRHAFQQGHINASFADSSKPEFDPDVDYDKLKEEQDKNIDNIDSNVNWHYDSVPLVCVVMLSAPKNMIGGETGIRLGDESIMRIPNTEVGNATMLQGRVIKHIATKPLNNFDRISYVSSFIPSDPNRKDTTCATSERPAISPAFTNDLFYPTFVDYRFDRVEKRLKSFRTQLVKNKEAGKKFDQKETAEFIKDIENYLSLTYVDFEMLEEKPYPPPHFLKPYDQL